MKVC